MRQEEREKEKEREREKERKEGRREALRSWELSNIFRPGKMKIWTVLSVRIFAEHTREVFNRVM